MKKFSIKQCLNAVKLYNIFNCKFAILSVFVIALCFSFFAIKKYSFNKGIDFSGGLVVEISCDNCNVVDIKNEISKKIGVNVSDQKIDGGFLLKMPIAEDYDKILNEIKVIIFSKFKNDNVKIVGSDYVSPQMSNDFLKDAINACIFSFACIGIYMMIRFNYKFAIAGILSILYDTIIVVGCISFLNIEVCLITLTALLTIIGYCINDKIVVFDRIRDILEAESNKSSVDVVFISIKLVFTRSLLTSMTTMLICSSLLFFGDKSIYELGLTINCGVFFGTISSLLLAPSLVLLFKVSKKKKPVERDLMFFAS